MQGRTSVFMFMLCDMSFLNHFMRKQTRLSHAKKKMMDINHGKINDEEVIQASKCSIVHIHIRMCLEELSDLVQSVLFNYGPHTTHLFLACHMEENKPRMKESAHVASLTLNIDPTLLSYNVIQLN
ncbi:hypothetical protein ACJX0J_040890 [Zea mays]